MRVLRKLLAPFRNQTADAIVTDRPAIVAAPMLAPRVPDRQRIAQDAADHVSAERYAASLALLDQALEAAPRDAGLLFARGSTLFAWGRFIEARACLLEAQRHDRRNADANVKLGWACVWTGKLGEALDAMRRAAEARPDDWAAHFGAGTVLRAQGNATAATASFERALALDPANLHCLSSLVACEIDQGHLEAAERHARHAIDLGGTGAAAWSDLGMVLCEQERFDEAIAAFERAQAIHATTGDAPDEMVNFAICLLRSGRTGQALALLERNLPHYPSATGHSQYALALLTSGRLVEGFDQYEFRWMEPPLSASRAKFAKPAWTGQDLRGRTILVRSEQGFGDFIQFCRYARHVKALGATVLVVVRDELRALAEKLDGIDGVLGPNDPYPPFDFYSNLLSLPRVFLADANTVPADVPYLPIDAQRESDWAARFASETRIKVGLVWAGSPTHARDRFRSLSLKALAPLLALDSVQMYSLQKGPAAAEVAGLADKWRLVDLSTELHTFADTVAAISQLDLVIGVDTVVMHVAGALAKPVWVMLPNPADWRWLEDRDDSAWYPTMRLFRQRDHGNWDEVIRRVTDALEVQVREGQALRSADRASTCIDPSAPLRPVAGLEAKRVDGISRVAETRMGPIQHFLDRSEASESIVLYGEYLQQLLDALAPLIKPGMTAMEVGAGAGIHALWLSRALGPGGHLLLYESDARQRQVLKQNLSANDVTNATVMRRSLEGERAASPTGLETIDDLRLARLDCLKIDGTADAAKVLQGAADTLWRLRPAVCVSLADVGTDALTAQVKRFGYACWICRVPLFNAANFNLRDEDIFAGRASLALLALPEERSAPVVESAYIAAHA